MAVVAAKIAQQVAIHAPNFTFFIVTTRPTLNVHFLPAEFLNPTDELERGYEEIASVPARSAAWALREISCISMGAMALTM